MGEIIKLLLAKFGYAIIDKGQIIPRDLRKKVKDPLAAKYFARHHTFLIEADFKNCIVLCRFSCEKYGRNPLVNVASDYIQNGTITYSDSELESFYNNYQPPNLAEMFQLEGKLHDDLVRLPADWVVFPWENGKMENKVHFLEKLVRYETKSRGRELSLGDGYGLVGPISRARGELEISTLINLIESIKANGYRRGDGDFEDIKASVLIDGTDYKYFIKDGIHRLVVLSALGYETAPVRVLPTTVPAFIYRNEVEFWPNVRRGLYTESQALKIFDTIFDRSPVYEE